MNCQHILTSLLGEWSPLGAGSVTSFAGGYLIMRFISTTINAIYFKLCQQFFKLYSLIAHFPCVCFRETVWEAQPPRMKLWNASIAFIRIPLVGLPHASMAGRPLAGCLDGSSISLEAWADWRRKRTLICLEKGQHDSCETVFGRLMTHELQHLVDWRVRANLLVHDFYELISVRLLTGSSMTLAIKSQTWTNQQWPTGQSTQFLWKGQTSAIQCPLCTSCFPLALDISVHQTHLRTTKAKPDRMSPEHQRAPSRTNGDAALKTGAAATARRYWGATAESRDIEVAPSFKITHHGNPKSRVICLICHYFRRSWRFYLGGPLKKKPHSQLGWEPPWHPGGLRICGGSMASSPTITLQKIAGTWQRAWQHFAPSWRDHFLFASVGSSKLDSSSIRMKMNQVLKELIFAEAHLQSRLNPLELAGWSMLK